MFTEIGTVMLKMDVMRGELFDGVSYREVVRDEVPDDEKHKMNAWWGFVGRRDDGR